MRFDRTGSGRVVAAFSLIELLVVISIIAVLASMLLPVVGMIREQAYTQGCQSNQRQIVMAVLMYAEENETQIPHTTGGSSQPNAALFDQYIATNSSNGKGEAKVWQCTAPAMKKTALWIAGFKYYLNWGSLDDPLISSPKCWTLPMIKRTTDAMLCYDGDASGRSGYHRGDKAVASFMDGHVISRHDDSWHVTYAWGPQDPGPTVAIEYLQYTGGGGSTLRTVKGWAK